ncbi:hypothetical protein ElyMa_004083400 [Elysia marginata]|uniref:Uncharacterized protein n=1 Tax=Elysia marginata TaxID=1093978 RepID=A0AAV4G843_9GAST|nr:hypothetical protein ElyMa_004083400 [Elysia marginata]
MVCLLEGQFFYPQKISKAPGYHEMEILPTYLRFCVPPRLEVALHIGSPLLSMLCIMSPCRTLQLYQVVSPSATLSSSSSSAISWLPLGHSLYPAIVNRIGLRVEA